MATKKKSSDKKVVVNKKTIPVRSKDGKKLAGSISLGGKKAPTTKVSTLARKAVVKKDATKKTVRPDWLPEGATIKLSPIHAKAWQTIEFHGSSWLLPPEGSRGRDSYIESLKSDMEDIKNHYALEERIGNKIKLDGKTKYGSFNKEIFGLSIRQVVSVFGSKVRFEDEEELEFENGDPAQRRPSSSPAVGEDKENIFKWLRQLQTLTEDDIYNIIDSMSPEYNLSYWWKDASNPGNSEEGRPPGTLVVPTIPEHYLGDEEARNIKAWIAQLSSLNDAELKRHIDAISPEYNLHWWWGNLANFEGSKNKEIFKQSASRVLGGFGEKIEAYEYEDRAYESDTDYTDESNWFWNN